MISAVACQSFAGGLDLGMSQAGLTLLHKTELKGGFGSKNVLVNKPLIGNGDWTYEDGPDYADFSIPKADVVYGCPPCSGFSVMTVSSFRGVDSPVNSCMRALVAVAARAKPLAVVMESVQQAFWTGLPLMRQLRDSFEAAIGQPVWLNHVLHNAHLVGNTAERRRYFMVLTVGRPLSINESAQAERNFTLRDAIGDLETQPLSASAMPYLAYATSAYGIKARAGGSEVDGHIARDGTWNRKLISMLTELEWRQGEYMSQVVTRDFDANGKMHDAFKHAEQKMVGRGREANGTFRMGFTQPTRWRYDAPSRVITGGAGYGAIHPVNDRTFTYREMARIMGYPDTWLIEPNIKASAMPLWWGKQVTVECGKWIGDQVVGWMNEELGEDVGLVIGERETVFEHTVRPRREFQMSKFGQKFVEGWARPVRTSNGSKRTYGPYLPGDRRTRLTVLAELAGAGYTGPVSYNKDRLEEILSTCLQRDAISV